MTKSNSGSQVRLIVSTNVIFDADEACAMLRIGASAATPCTGSPPCIQRQSML